jgi:hypothetical protein
MCTISEKTDLKMVTVYKVAIKWEGNYYSLFSGYLIKKGKVLKEWKAPTSEGAFPIYFISYLKGAALYNPNMIGRVSGFATRESVEEYYQSEQRFGSECIVLLEIKLGGSIMKGDASCISLLIEPLSVTYAGTKIIDFKEVQYGRKS